MQVRPLGEVDLVSRMAALAPDLVAALEQATTLGDISRIEGGISDIAPVDPLLAAELAAMAHEFEHEQILSLIRRAKGEAYGEYEPIHSI